jgi:uncharacterized metal-binding protein YceD (DUF177 family)
VNLSFSPALIDENHPLELKGELAVEVLQLDPAVAKTAKPVKIEVMVIKDDDGNYLATGWAVANLSMVCGRCTEWFPMPVRAKVEHFFEPPTPNSIDLTPLIREDVLLELPLNAVCRLGADGRCPVTGEIYQPRPESSGSIVSEGVWDELSKVKTKD